MRTLFFYGNPVDDAVRRTRHITTDSPAGSRKMQQMARALRSQGVRVVLVSTGRGRADGSGRFDGVRVGRLGGVPIMYGPMFHKRGWSELLSMAWLVWAALRLTWRNPAARHLFYNQFTMYLPALMLLHALRRPTLCDIEDGPVAPDRQVTRRSRGDAPPHLFARLISNGALLACTALRDGTRIRPTMPCYGAIEPVIKPPRSAMADQVVIMTGMFDAATGVATLATAFAVMAEEPSAFRNIRFEFAGFGPLLAELQATAERLKIRAIFHGRLDVGAYADVLRRATIGLSLKAVEGPYAQSTFPSKVVEYAQHGLCVIATDISDVRRVLGDTAWYLDADDPAQLLAHLRRASAEPELVATVGCRSKTRVETMLSFAAVGSALRNFIFEPAT